ncbi:MAG: hypothetical protein J0L67_09625 [Cytophagales bacterium]|nr:hypothetical protein [Cytophagales bacterium]
MKKCYLITSLACLILFACDESKIKPETNFIKAKVNGVEMVFNVFPEEQLNYIAIGRNYLAITLRKDVESSEYWAITVSNVDIDKIKLPFTIEGPNHNYSGKFPEFFTTIYDPNGGPYGKSIAGANTHNSNISVTLTSFDGEVIKGTFEGSDFSNGEFQMKLQRLKL